MSTVLITGANGNLGQAVTERMLKDGNRVLALVGSGGAGDLPENEMLETHQVDLMEGEKTTTFIESALEKHPELDAAVLLVGGFAMGRLSESSPEELDKMLRLNFYTTYHIVRNLLPYFLNNEKGGRFILIGSRPGLNPKEGKDMFAYTLAKSMVYHLAEFINVEGKGNNVTATVIVPSVIDTEDNRKAMPDADFSSWVPPENIADSISFVLSDTGRMFRETVIKIYNES